MGVAHKDVGIVELGAGHAALGIDFQDFAAVQFDLGGLAEFHVELLDGGLEDRFRAGVDVEAQFLVVVNDV